MLKKILLVEDQALIALNTSTILQAEGFSIVTAYNGLQALDLAFTDTDISLVLMDIDLGSGMDGTETARLILEKKDLPIVFLTSHAEKEMVARVKNITRYGYVLKNSGEFVLLEAIQMAWELFSANKKIVSEAKETGHLRNLFEYVVKHTPVGIVVLDRDFRYLYVSDQIIRDNKFEFADLKGLSHYELHPNLPEKLKQLHRRAMEGEVLHCADDTFTRPDGSTDYTSWEMRPWHESGGQIGGIIIYTTILNKYKKLLTEASKKAEDYSSIFNNAPVGIFISTIDGHMLHANLSAVRMMGAVNEEEGLRYFNSEDSPFNVDPSRRQDLWQLLKVCEGVENFEFPGRTIQGDIRWFSMNISLRRQEDGPVLMEGFVRDISESKSWADQLLALNGRLEKALDEKKQLMKELNHRVKNNLLMVNSLLRLKEYAGDINLSDIRSQVQAIGLVHEKLSYSDSQSRVNLREYLDDLVETVFSSFASRKVSIKSSVCDIPVSSKIALELGLIVNEIAMNSLKYAFAGKDDPEFFISLQLWKNGGCLFTAGNNGQPFRDPQEVTGRKTLGLRLIDEMVKQMGGTCTLESSPSPLFRIILPDIAGE